MISDNTGNSRININIKPKYDINGRRTNGFGCSSKSKSKTQLQQSRKMMAPKSKKTNSNQIGSHLVDRLPKTRILNMPKKKSVTRKNSSLGQN